MKTFIKLALVSNLALFAVTPAFAGQSVKQLMNKYYSPVNKSTNCRYIIGGNTNEKKCMKVKKAKQVKTKYGKRLYLLMTGNAVESSGHVATGVVGMFVLAPDGKNKWKVVSAKPKMNIGSWGEAPTDWTFRKFAPNKWGFLATTGYGMGGQFTEGFNILTPSGKSIKHNLIMASDNFDNCELSKVACYDLSAKIKINRSKIVNGYYPLILTVNGKSETGKRYKNRKYQATYKKGKGYTTPKNYPISIE